MSSGSIFPQRLTEIDDLTRPDHSYLELSDRCYFLGEYTARKGFAFSATNNLIHNFKKPVDRRGRPEWRYKEQAIRDAAAALRGAIRPDGLDTLTFVPIPPSKAKTDPLYDDRMVQMLRTIRPAPPLDIRELIVQHVSTGAAHQVTTRPRPADLEAIYAIDQNLTAPPPQLIMVVDDVLTTGAHFKAASVILGRRFPGVSLVGVFLARRVPEADDFDPIIATS
jgi:hypothetical protein